MTLFKRSWPSAVRSTSAFCPFYDADRDLCKACADKTRVDQWEKHETFPQVFVVMTNTIISQGCLCRAQSCGMSVMHGECESSLLEQPHEQQVKATAQGERICVLPSFLTDLRRLTSVVSLPLPVMDLDWLYFPCLFPHLLPVSICWPLFLCNKSLDHLLAHLHSPYTVETRPKAGACGNCCNTIKGW